MAREESRAIFFMKVKATSSALKLIEELKAQHGEELLFHQSGGCCDGSAPMCYPRNEYMVGSSDVKLGEIGGVPFYIKRHSTNFSKLYVARTNHILISRITHWCTSVTTSTRLVE